MAAGSTAEPQWFHERTGIMPQSEQYEDCVVAFLDILGFSHAVRASEKQPDVLGELVKAMQVFSIIPKGERQ